MADYAPLIRPTRCTESAMPVDRPFRRTCRQLVDGSYLHNGNGRYVCHSRYAVAGRQYVRAFMLLQKDVLELFDYVEPADINLPCYSYRIHELHMRTCIEVEAHCKAILSENSYRGNSNDWTMNDYRKLDRTHHLSSMKFGCHYGMALDIRDHPLLLGPLTALCPGIKLTMPPSMIGTISLHLPILTVLSRLSRV